MGAAEGLQHQPPLFRPLPLHQGPLHGLLVGIGGDVDRLHGPGVQAGVVHTGGQGAGGGVEVLNLLGLTAGAVEPLGQPHRVVQSAARVRGDEVGHQVLLLAVLPVESLVLLPELLIDLHMGLSHVIQHPVDTVLRGHLELAGHVIFHQLGEELPVPVLHQVVEPDAGADEHLFDAGDGPDLPQQLEVVGLVGVQVGAGLGGQAGPVPAHARLELLLTGGMPEIGGGPAHVVDVALKAGVLHQALRLPQHALVAPGGDGPPLVEGQGAEVAGPKAAPVMDDGEADLLDGGHAPHGVVHGMGLSHIGQLEHGVQLGGGQGHGGGIGNEQPVPVLLQDGLPPHRVVLLVLHLIGLGVGPLVGTDRLEGGDLHHGVGALAGVPPGEAGAPHVGDLVHRRA